ncbi:MAG: sigma-70 family RNA polymerase sigma factor [Synergistaceae bacterium]|nr:sigma-70 family RNA polymerase sigma factor [Synergistaceae bacterium]
MLFKELLNKLHNCPEMAQTEQALRNGESLLLDGTKSKKKTIGHEQLRAKFRRIAAEQVKDKVACEVFANGFAIYDNGSRETVIRLSAYEHETYKYHSNTLDSDFFAELRELPWSTVVCLIGEDRISYNLHHSEPLQICDFETDELLKGLPYAFSSNPETAYLRHEFYETLRSISDQNAEVFWLYHEYGYSQSEIAKILKVSQQAVSSRLVKFKNTIKKIRL